MVTVRNAPDRLRLCLYAGDTAEDDDRAIEDAQRAFDLGGEIDVAGRIDQVELVLFPVTGYRCSGDGNTTFTFFLIAVCDRIAIVHITDAMPPACAKQDAFGKRCLAGIDMRHDAEVSELG